jgi:anaerobic magnesium-protoporphyrin IX monomethyl ester cyclase
MKVLLINPPYTKFEGMEESAGSMMPLSLGYLAAFARQYTNNIEFSILDAEAEGMGYDQIRENISKITPDVVGITTPTPVVKHAYKISRITKEINKKAYVVLGGIHPTVLPERTLKDCSEVDFVVKGEGEEIFHQLLKSIEEDFYNIENIPRLIFRSNRKVIQTGHGTLIENLDSIPFPARDLYKLELYRSAPTKKVSDDDATPILTSRGCPYSCKHCPSEIIWNRSVRFRSADNVLLEISECVNKYNLKEFNFFDDTFTINKKRAIEVCKKIKESNLNISWICFSRTNTIDDELVTHMKDAGCKKISFGLESGEQKILDMMKKKTTIDMGKNAVLTVRRHNIPVHASFMLGNIGETEDSIAKTIDFAKSLDLDNATFFLTTPFPGTELFKIAEGLGNITENTPWENFAPLTNSPPILVQNNLSTDRLIELQKQAFRQFYLRPAYILKKFKLLFSIEGIKTLFEGLSVFVRILKKGK